jgi:transcriptional regulator with XRE-family HTH domain
VLAAQEKKRCARRWGVNIIKQYREKLGITKAEAARRCQMQVRNYANTENGKRAVGAEIARRLSAGLGIPIEKLLQVR